MVVSVNLSGLLKPLIEIHRLVEFYTGIKIPEQACYLTDYELQGDSLILNLKPIDHHTDTTTNLPPIPLRLYKEDFEMLFRDMSDELQKPIGLEKLKGALLVCNDYFCTLSFEVEEV